MKTLAKHFDLVVGP